MKIQHFENKNIDRSIYDKILSESSFGNLYSCSWYLDVVNPGWELLADENFNFIMPIAAKKKFGIKYIVQPYFTQQLGVFGKEIPDNETINSFIKAIPYKRYYIQFNESTPKENFRIFRKNYILNLENSYEILHKSFNSNCKRNLKKAESKNLLVKKLSVNEFINFVKANSEVKILKQKIELIQQIVEAVEVNLGDNFLKAVVDKESNILAVGFFPEYKNRIYNLIPVSSKAGKESNAMTFLLNNIIFENSSQAKILDFEGSEISSIACFFESFGSGPLNFPVINKKLFGIL